MIASKIIGHRGFSSLAPENTLAAMSIAAKKGVEWVEIDALACGDGSIVMWHDETVDRCSDGTGTMSDHTIDSLKQLDCGSWFSPEFNTQRISTIEEAILSIQSLGLGLNLELKRYDSNLKTLVDPVLKLLQKHWLDFDKLIISSFDQATLTYCHQQAPYLQLGQLYGKIPDNWLAQMQAINAVSCHCNHLHLQQSQVTDLKQAGYDVYCYTVNEPQLVENHWKWGIDGIFTDYPQRF